MTILYWIGYKIKGRLRSNKDMLNRKDLRGMFKALRKGETIWYAPDHDYGRKNAVFVPFFAVQEAATTTGSYYLLKSAPNCKVVPFAHYVIKMVQAIRSVFLHLWIFLIFQMKLQLLQE